MTHVLLIEDDSRIRSIVEQGLKARDFLVASAPDGETGLEMARSLQEQHPDVTKITRKWGRWQHHVDYRPFKANRLVRREGVEVPEGVNDYGMRLVQAV